jgi:aldehyde:ferredoxin oxidoreductase
VVVDSCGNCKSGGTFVMAEVYWEEQAQSLSVTTGVSIDVERLKLIGERIYNLQRCYNALHGITRADDVLPWRFTKSPSPSGNAKGSVCRLDEMLPEYYALRGWDPETGLPQKETLVRLGLDGVAERLAEAFESGSAQAMRPHLRWALPRTDPPRKQ